MNNDVDQDNDLNARFIAVENRLHEQRAQRRRRPAIRLVRGINLFGQEVPVPRPRPQNQVYKK